jgi:hypothetical protein
MITFFVCHNSCFFTYTKGLFGDGLDRTQLKISKKKKISKSTPTFLLFISYQLLFITIQIKKSLQNKKFHFFIQNILFFFSHQSNLLQYQSISSSPVHCQTQPKSLTILDKKGEESTRRKEQGKIIQISMIEREWGNFYL